MPARATLTVVSFQKLQTLRKKKAKAFPFRVSLDCATHRTKNRAPRPVAVLYLSASQEIIFIPHTVVCLPPFA